MIPQFQSSINIGKVFRKDHLEETLYCNIGARLNIYFGIKNGPASTKGEITNFDGASIADFRIVKNKMILSACNNMQLYLHEAEMSQGVRLICKIDIGLPMTENITAIAVCPLNKYIAVATEKGDIFTNLTVFELNEANFIDFRAEMNFYNDTQYQKQYNYIRDLSLELTESDNSPIILGYQFAADKLLLPFLFDGRRLVRYAPAKVHTGIVNKVCSLNNQVWSVDMYGLVKRISNQP